MNSSFTKFSIFTVVLLLVFLLAISISCYQSETFSQYQNISNIAAASTIQDSVYAQSLLTTLNGSYLMNVLGVSLANEDVVVPYDGTGSSTPVGTILSNAKVEPTSMYVADDVASCVNPMSAGISRSRNVKTFRMLDAHYLLMSVCFRIRVTGTTISASPAAAAILLLAPVAYMGADGVLLQITSLSVTGTGDLIMTVAGSNGPVQSSWPHLTSATFFFLQYQSATIDATVAPAGSLPTVWSFMNGTSLVWSSASKSVTYDFSQPNTLTQPQIQGSISPPSSGYYPGIINAATVALQMSVMPFTSNIVVTTISDPLSTFSCTTVPTDIHLDYVSAENVAGCLPCRDSAVQNTCWSSS
jgi:hypothetical protein